MVHIIPKSSDCRRFMVLEKSPNKNSRDGSTPSILTTWARQARGYAGVFATLIVIMGLMIPLLPREIGIGIALSGSMLLMTLLFIDFWDRYLRRVRKSVTEKLSEAEEVAMIENIATLNDQLRKTGRGGYTVLSPKIALLDEQTIRDILARVAAYSDFDTKDYKVPLRDFGTLMIKAQSIFFLITYFTPDMQGYSENPAERTKIIRILSVFLAEEYGGKFGNPPRP